MTKIQLPPEARVDLSATVSGQFSSEDWSKILARAESQLSEQLQRSGDPHQAWQEVVRDFYSQRYWGFEPKSVAQMRKIEPQKQKNMGVKLIWITFQAMCVTKVIVLWLGQTYSRSHDTTDFLWLLLAIFAVVAGFAHFLWGARNYKD